MARNHPEKWPDIFDHTTGLVFFGTPFRGASGMNQVEMLEAARLKYSDEQIQGETLHILQSESEMLLNLKNDFCEIKGERMITCYYERIPTCVGKIFGRNDFTVRHTNKVGLVP